MLLWGVLRAFGCCALLIATAVAAFARAPKPKWETLPLPPAMPEPTAHDFCSVEGAKIYYAIYGDGDPVVLLHGGLGNADHWAFQLPALVEHHRVIAIDSRGQGRSTRGSGAATYDRMASDVVAVLDQLSIAKASFVGWSDGGEIALKIAVRHPERVAKLFVFGANYDANGSKPHHPRAQTFASYAVKCRADYEKLSGTPRQWSAAVEWLAPVWKSPMGFTKDQLRAITAPTVIGDGEHDEIILRAQLEEMVQLIPHAKLLVVPDTSHFAMWQDPAAFNKALVEFLASP
jgi:pimeloyl-ACP methyl ester carboxylesterase